MSLDQDIITNSGNAPPVWQPVPRGWRSKSTGRAAPNGAHRRAGEAQTPMERWFNETQSDAPYDNVGAVKEALTATDRDGAGATGGQ